MIPQPHPAAVLWLSLMECYFVLQGSILWLWGRWDGRNYSFCIQPPLLPAPDTVFLARKFSSEKVSSCSFFGFFPPFFCCCVLGERGDKTLPLLFSFPAVWLSLWPACQNVGDGTSLPLNLSFYLEWSFLQNCLVRIWEELQGSYWPQHQITSQGFFSAREDLTSAHGGGNVAHICYST